MSANSNICIISGFCLLLFLLIMGHIFLCHWISSNFLLYAGHCELYDKDSGFCYLENVIFFYQPFQLLAIHLKLGDVWLYLPLECICFSFSLRLGQIIVRAHSFFSWGMALVGFQLVRFSLQILIPLWWAEVKSSQLFPTPWILLLQGSSVLFCTCSVHVCSASI